MKHLFAALFAVLFCVPACLQAQSAQDIVWVQIEAQPSLAGATERARAYSGRIEDVNGFSLGQGWYGIAVGPYRRGDAEVLLREYRREGLIPRDSFIQVSDRFQQQFWPVGANVLNIPLIAPIEPDPTPQISQTTLPPAPDAAAVPATPLAEADQAAVAPAPPVDETPAEARRSEADLTRTDREQLQVALQWAGFYDAAIDGAFGRGTRNSMADWQVANGYDATGILTTLQRADLLKQYNAVLDGLGLQMVRDAQAGIEMHDANKGCGF